MHEIYLKQSFTVIRAKIQRYAGLNGPVKVNNLVEKEKKPGTWDKLIVAVNRKCKISTWQHTQVQRSAQTILQ